MMNDPSGNTIEEKGAFGTEKGRDQPLSEKLNPPGGGETTPESSGGNFWGGKFWGVEFGGKDRERTFNQWSRRKNFSGTENEGGPPGLNWDTMSGWEKGLKLKNA